MKRAFFATLSLILCLGLCGGALAQDKSEPRTYTTTREFKNRVFEVKHRDPRTIASAVKLLGSGFEGADLSVNDDLNTITVRDFPENIAAIEEAIRRLDQATAGKPEIEFHIYALIGSSSPAPASELPAEIVDVVKELHSTLRYTSYNLLMTSMHRTRPGNGIESNGVAETMVRDLTPPRPGPVWYNYSLRRISVGQVGTKQTAEIEGFRFAMKYPLTFGENTNHQDIGFDTPVTIREGEKVVVGTTTMGDKALIVVVTAKIDQAK
jgi:type II/III secretion system protein